MLSICFMFCPSFLNMLFPQINFYPNPIWNHRLTLSKTDLTCVTPSWSTDPIPYIIHQMTLTLTDLTCVTSPAVVLLCQHSMVVLQSDEPSFADWHNGHQHAKISLKNTFYIHLVQYFFNFTEDWGQANILVFENNYQIKDTCTSSVRYDGNQLLSLHKQVSLEVEYTVWIYKSKQYYSHLKMQFCSMTSFLQLFFLSTWIHSELFQ